MDISFLCLDVILSWLVLAIRNRCSDIIIKRHLMFAQSIQLSVEWSRLVYNVSRVLSCVDFDVPDSNLAVGKTPALIEPGLRPIRCHIQEQGRCQELDESFKLFYLNPYGFAFIF